MIEGQEGLTWERWRRLARATEDGGFHGLFRADHLTGLFGDPTRGSLDTWASLTWLASNSTRLRFGPLVCPLTFHHPPLLAKRAAAVADLSGGRLDLGIGAGWHEGEHAMFGVPFPPLKERMDRFECGARAIRALWQGRPVTLDQPYYPLRDAESYPVPPGGRVPLIIGGRGERRTLPLVAACADEWNTTRITLEDYPAKVAALEASCRAAGRDPPLADGALHRRSRRARARCPARQGAANLSARPGDRRGLAFGRLSLRRAVRPRRRAQALGKGGRDARHAADTRHGGLRRH